MNDQTDKDAQSVEPQMVSPGARLAAYRQERGWTVEQVASQLNLAPRQIVAIESDDYPALPGMPIVRGFIRAYAKLLKVDAAPLLATLGGETVLVHDTIEPRKTLSTPFSETRLPSMTERPGLSSKWVLGALVVALLGVAIWASRHDSAPKEAQKPSSAQADSAPAATANTSQPQPVPASEQGMASTPAAVAPSAQEPAQATVPADAGATPPAAAPQAVPVQQQPAPEQAAQSSGGKDRLELKVREDSWIEVRRASNNGILVSRIVKAGESESVEVTEPISVVIGNAAGVEASLRGAPVDLKTKGNTNVARLNLK